MSTSDSPGDDRWDQVMDEYWRRQESEGYDDGAFLDEFSDVRDRLAEFLEQRRIVQAQSSSEEVSVGMPPAQAPSFPKKFGNFLLQRELGRGGMGVVYEAIQDNPRRTVALKMILDSQLASPTDVERFKKEAQTAAVLQHSNIVAIFEVGVHNRKHYFSMEYVDGETLSDKVRQTALTADRAARYVRTIAETIAFAHGCGILHRDLTPSNILIDHRDQPKITDFGLTKRIDDPQQLTITGKILGKPNYVSPEQAGGKQLGPTSDVYSLGAVLYELLTGRPPFQSDSIQDTLWMASHEEPVGPRRLNPKIPKDIETICMKCLAKEAGKRYQKAQALADDLGRFLRQEPITARPIGNSERAWRWCRRNPVIARLIFALLFSLGLGVGGVLWQWRQATTALAATRSAQSERTFAQVDALLAAEAAAVPTILENLKPFRSEAVPRLRQLLLQPDLPEGRRVRMALGLLPNDPRQADYLQSVLLELADAKEFLLVRTALAPFGRELTPTLWRAVDDGRTERRFRAACALAEFDPANPRWAQLSLEVVGALVAQESLQAAPWMAALRPVRDDLREPLLEIYRDRQRPEAERIVATQFLVEYAADHLPTLVKLVQDADPWQFSVLWPKLELRRDELTSLLGASLRSISAITSSDPNEPKLPILAAGEDQTLSASRIANMYVALLRLGEADSVWPSMRHSTDPSIRTHLVHRLARMGVDPALLIERYASDPDVSERRALLLALGEYSFDRLPADRRSSLAARMSDAYVNDPDPGLHSALDWVLRRWGYEAEQAELDQRRVARNPTSGAGWYVNSLGHCLTVVPGPVEFTMGAASDEFPLSSFGELTLEPQHHRRLPRSFAIATKETTVAQFEKFRTEIKLNHFYAQAFSPGPNAAIGNVNWHEAALYCRWLSEKEGIPESQMCYRAPKAGDAKLVLEPYSDHLERTGYRLPTEAEWEYACRANATTPHFFGAASTLLGHYAWYSGNAREFAHDVASRMPNDLGLFDMHGNVAEWCQDSPSAFMMLAHVVALGDGRITDDTLPSHAGAIRALRGGSFNSMERLVRSAARHQGNSSGHDYTIGFRVARTIKSPAQGSLWARWFSSPPIEDRAIVRLASIDELNRKVVPYMLSLTDDQRMKQLVAERIAEASQVPGLTANPWQVLVQSDREAIYPIAFQQFSSEQEALEMVRAMYPDHRELAGGILQLSNSPPQYYRYASNFAYMAWSRKQLEGSLPNPDQHITELARGYDVAVTFKPDHVPKSYASFLSAAGFGSLVDDADELTIGLRVSVPERKGLLEATLRIQPQSNLSRYLSQLTPRPSRFEGLLSPEAAFCLAVTYEPNQDSRRFLTSLINVIGTDILAKGAMHVGASASPQERNIMSVWQLTEVNRLVGEGLIAEGLDMSIFSSPRSGGDYSTAIVVHAQNAQALAHLFESLGDKVQAVDPVHQNYMQWKIYNVRLRSNDSIADHLQGTLSDEYIAFGPQTVASVRGPNGTSEIRALIDRISALPPSSHIPPTVDVRVRLAHALNWLENVSAGLPDPAQIKALARRCLTRDDELHLIITQSGDRILLRCELGEGLLRFVMELVARTAARPTQ